MGTLLQQDASEMFNKYFQGYSLGRFTKNKRRDLYLHKLLLSLANSSGGSNASGFIPDEVPKLGFAWPDTEREKKALPSLMGAMGRLSTDKSLTVYDIYDGSVALEFHLLLLSIISSFRWALRMYHNSIRGGDVDMGQRIRAGRSVKNYGTILWRIAYSQLLEYHLELLEYYTPLQSPKYSDRQQYRDKLKLQVAQSDVGGGDCAYPLSESNRPPDEEDCADPPNESDLLPDHENGSPAKASSIRSWLRLLVAHFTGVDTLSDWSRSHTTEIQDCIKLVRIARPDPNMKCWKAVIRTPRVSPDPETDINLLISLIEKAKARPDIDTGLVTLFRKGGLREKVTTVVFTGNQHCESALASLPNMHSDEATAWTLEQIEQRIDNASPSEVQKQSICPLTLILMPVSV